MSSELELPWPEGSARTELWYAWAEIAIDNERRAVTARRAGRRSLKSDEALGRAIARETLASMVAVVASAAALETMGKNLAQFLVDVPGGSSAAGRMLATAEAVFPNAEIDDRLRADVQSLFELRNETAHYGSKWEELTPHPVGRKTTRVAATYSVEAAAFGVSTVLDLLRRLTKPGRSPSGDAEFWAIRWRSLPEQLLATRSRLRLGRAVGETPA